MKSCTRCNRMLTLDHFKSDRRKAEGKASVCKDCSRAACAIWRQENADHVRTYEKSPERLIHERDRSRLPGHKYRPRRKASSPQQLARKAACQAAWEKANPDKVRVIWRNKRAKRRAAEGIHSPADIERIVKAQRGKCAYCRRRLGKKFHVDHIVALGRDGTNWPRNLQATCADCNQAKNATDPIIFAQRIGRLF